MAKEDFTTLRLHKTNINRVKVAIPGTGYTLGSFYEQAALEKIEREKINLSPNQSKDEKPIL